MWIKAPDLPSVLPVISSESHSWMIRIQLMWKTQRAMKNRFSPHTKSGVSGGADVHSVNSHQYALVEFLNTKGESTDFFFFILTFAFVSSVCITVS